MPWLSSFFIAFITGAFGLVCAGVVAELCMAWYRVSSREGASSYYMIFIALLGGIASFVIGLVVARYVAAGAAPGFMKGLGIAAGAVLGLSLLALAISWLGADLAPKINGRALELAIEVRCPKSFILPKEEPDEWGATAGVYLPGGRQLPTAPLRLDAAKIVDGQLIVSAAVPLTTSASQKFLSVRFSKETNLIFGLHLRSHPGDSDQEWSKWVDSGWEAGKPEPAKEEKFNIRYRVQAIEPAPPPPNPGDVTAQQFAALKPDALLAQILPFLFNEPTPERTEFVLKAIGEKQLELAQLIRSADATVRWQALHAATYPLTPASEITEAALAEGRDIAAAIRRCNELTPDDPQFHAALVELRPRFNAWRDAWWTIHKRAGRDGRPPVEEIHDLSLVRARGTAMSEIEEAARMFLEELNQLAAKKKP